MAGAGEGGWCSCADESRLPVHIGFIPDGNRRWARARGLPPWEGHVRGYEVARRTLDLLWGLGVPVVSFYGMSLENCTRRPLEERLGLYRLLERAAEDLLADERVSSGKVRVVFAGDLSLLPLETRRALENANRATEGNGPFVLVVAVCYSPWWELREACRRGARGERGELPLGWLPPLDLVVRTGGEKRLSGFLLPHLGYAELYFTDTLWPEFGEEELCRAICWFQGRERRFGG